MTSHKNIVDVTTEKKKTKPTYMSINTLSPLNQIPFSKLPESILTWSHI